MPFEPSKGLFGWSWEAIPGVPGGPRRDLPFAGGSLSYGTSGVPRTAILGATESPAPLPGKHTGEGTILLDALNPADIWGPAAWYFGGCDTTNPSAGVYEHRFAAGASGTVFPETFTTWLSRDDGMPDRGAYARCGNLEFSFTERELISCTPTIVSQVPDFWDYPVLGAGTGTSGCLVRGHLAAQFGDVATDNLGLEVTAVVGDLVTLRGKLGDAAVFAGAGWTVTRGTWGQVYDEADLRLGDLGTPVQVYIPTSGTVVVGDTYSVARRMDVWLPSFSDQAPVNEVFSVVSFDDDSTFYVEGLTLALSHGTTEARYGFGGKRARLTRSRGERTATWTINREYLDLALRRKLTMGEAAKIEVYCRSGVQLGAGNEDFAVRVVSANCRITEGTVAAVESKEAMNESITLTAHPSSDATDPEGVVMYVYNDLAVLPTV